jgi:hypothetical protein
MVETVHALTVRARTWQETTELVEKLNRVQLSPVTEARLRRGRQNSRTIFRMPRHIFCAVMIWQPWSDVIADRGAEIGAAMLDFLDRHPLPAVRLSEPEGEAAGVLYRICGAGPPLAS